MTATFVAVEGPNGVGKTTIAGLLTQRMNGWRGHEAVLTTEPTRSPLGDLLRASEWTLQGRALALALAADRAEHIESMIIPALDRGQHVITDRYVQSSMVLQRIDGLDPDEIWTYNQYALQCTTIYLVDRPDVIAARLAARSSLTRLELTGSPERELEYYRDAAAFLAQPDHSWTQHTVDCHGRRPHDIVDEIFLLLSQERTPE
ncbi:dTMP kinase [Catellatospora sp. NPDC049111]|uniref:dTMP kinase n=1 Tax=Catellatospora sp. NPDC049111 TaxID=3155271 RepID=UPI0033F8740B